MGRSKNSFDSLARIWLFLWILIALFMWYVPLPYELRQSLATPSWSHPFGSDVFGRDLLTLSLHASLRSFFFALIAVSLTVFAGSLIGIAIALAPKKIKIPGLYALELSLSFPSLLLALSWAAVFGPGWSTLIISLLLGTIPMFSRFTYVRSVEILTSEYIENAYALGARRRRIITKHLLPVLKSTLSVKIPNLFVHALIAEATLSFLGIGAPIGTETWGSLLAQGKDYLIESPHIAFATGIPLILSTLSLQKLSETRVH